MSHLDFLPWTISLVVATLSILGWSQDMGWRFSGLTGYEWFPFFGVLAYGLMWAHYAVDFFQRFWKFEARGPYLSVTRYVVFFSLLMHPGILAWERWQEGFGLPPMSLLNFIPGFLGWWVIAGLVAWLTFMAFELHRWFSSKSWFRWVVLANSGAMILVIIHALYLAEPQGWFRGLFYFYLITLIIFLVKEYKDYRHKTTI